MFRGWREVSSAVTTVSSTHHNFHWQTLTVLQWHCRYVFDGGLSVTTLSPQYQSKDDSLLHLLLHHGYQPWTTFCLHLALQKASGRDEEINHKPWSIHMPGPRAPKVVVSLIINNTLSKVQLCLSMSYSFDINIWKLRVSFAYLCSSCTIGNVHLTFLVRHEFTNFATNGRFDKPCQRSTKKNVN